MSFMQRVFVLSAVIAIAGATVLAQDAADRPGVVANIKVMSDKNPLDVSSLAAWKKTYIKEGMSDQEKTIAIWKSVSTFQYQDNPPCEYLQNENLVLDPIKIFNVYGYSFCGVAASHVQALARYSGMKARGWNIVAHVVPEVWYDESWHMVDASLLNYFPKPDGKLASVAEIVAAVKAFTAANVGVQTDGQLRQFQNAKGRTGWKQGPELLAKCPFYSDSGWLPAKSHGWYSTMQEYSGNALFEYQNGYTCGYQVNIQLRPGEKITRNWSNKGLHVNMLDNPPAAPGCKDMKIGEGMLEYSATMFGDIAPGRVGNGLHEYEVPVADAGLARSAWRYENLEGGKSLHAKDAAKPGILEIRVPSSYVLLSGALATRSAGEIEVSFSDNNGLDWKPVGTGKLAAGEQKIDLKDLCFRRYDYRLRLTLKGKETALERLKLTHDIQHSQRPLPALGAGQNTITFSTGPQEGTVTMEGATDLAAAKGKQLLYTDFHPVVNGLTEAGLVSTTGKGDVTWTVDAPAAITRLRISSFLRMRAPTDAWDIQVSYDGGKTFKNVRKLQGPASQLGDYVEVLDVPAGVKSAQVRYSNEGGGCQLFNARIDADYPMPSSGHRPVKVTYLWEEGGVEKTDVHVAKGAPETWQINCQGKPTMKSIVLELAQ